MASIRCAHCKQTHESVDEVKACARDHGAFGHNHDGRTLRAPAYSDASFRPRENRAADPNDPLWSQYESYITENFPHVEVDRSQIERQEDFNCWKDRHGPRLGPREDKALPAGHSAYRDRDRGWDEVNRLRKLIPAGHFAVKIDDRWRFYKIDKPTEGRWAGYTFIKEQASDDYYSVKGQQRTLDILQAIAADPQKAMTDYGHQLGRCGKCRRTLTDPDSIARGIGPSCASKMGW